MSKKNDKSTRRAAAAEIVRQQKAAERRRAVMFQAGIGLVLIAIVVTVAVVVLRERDRRDDVAAGRGPAPTQVDDTGAFVIGSPDAPVLIELVEDLQCPACKAFEAMSGELIGSYIDDGIARVAYRGIAFLDRATSTRYSSRALNASACVMSEGPEVWRAFHEQMFVQQPPEDGGAGLSDAEIAAIAREAGATSEDLGQCIEDEVYGGWVKRTTEQVMAGGISSTPTIVVDGTTLESSDPATISAAVEKAQNS
ncbi:thioredoxin domain-containing protein [Nocardioides sp. R-C-SC26]|uniref:thioredoxin domain-containing protein n=1 Tax=Nocardioides sp. R-C-SC26 TaxID=2870414 RepID=UPI001E385649|nr:thioredoxin domain-containing protein [Nocardioides sp. R-C-SC26]